MDKLIERLQYELHCLWNGSRQFKVIEDAITALTQDRAAVLEEAADHFRKMAEGTVMGRGIVIDEVLSLKTPPAQAEPKRYWRRHANGGTTLTPDTRNPAVADRRKSAEGSWKLNGRRSSDNFVAPTPFGRRAGDRARWVEDKAQEAREELAIERGFYKGIVPTPPTQPAAEVSLVQWVQKRWSKVGMATPVVAYDLQEFAAQIQRMVNP